MARTQQDATWNRQQHSHQLRSLLREYYPSPLDAFTNWQNGRRRPEASELLRLAPTTSRAERLSRTQSQAALKRAGRYPQDLSALGEPTSRRWSRTC